MINSKMDSSKASKTSARWRRRFMSRERRTEREYARSLRKDLRKHLRNIRRAARRGEYKCNVHHPIKNTVERLECMGYTMKQHKFSNLWTAHWPRNFPRMPME